MTPGRKKWNKIKNKDYKGGTYCDLFCDENKNDAG